jgi:hypothetical protein
MLRAVDTDKFERHVVILVYHDLTRGAGSDG